jgi:hypothetical protein
MKTEKKINYKTSYKNLYKKLNTDYVYIFEKIISSFRLNDDYSKFLFLDYFFIKNKLNNNFRFNIDIYSESININIDEITYIIPSDFYKIIINNINIKMKP